jgi:hypothetical protein
MKKGWQNPALFIVWLGTLFAPATVRAQYGITPITESNRGFRSHAALNDAGQVTFAANRGNGAAPPVSHTAPEPGSTAALTLAGIQLAGAMVRRRLAEAITRAGRLPYRANHLRGRDARPTSCRRLCFRSSFWASTPFAIPYHAGLKTDAGR